MGFGRYFFVAVASFLLAPAFVFADLRVYPTRLLLTDNKKVDHISLRHAGKAPARYRISFEFFSMNPDGSMEIAKEVPLQGRIANSLLRFSPHEVTLTPGLEQVVRVMAIIPRNLQDGEYRTHLRFEPMDEPERQVANANPTPNEKKITMRLQAKVAVAVPVIVRHGHTNFNVKLWNLKLIQMPDKEIGYSAEMTAEGNAFVSVDLLVFFTPFGRNTQQIGLVKSVASYLPQRSIKYALTLPPDMQLKHGVLRLEARDTEEEGGKLRAFIEQRMF